ncbi:MAG: hypothetical protein ACTS2F_27600 [Thainema sp.]
MTNIPAGTLERFLETHGESLDSYNEMPPKERQKWLAACGEWWELLKLHETEPLPFYLAPQSRWPLPAPNGDFFHWLKDRKQYSKAEYQRSDLLHKLGLLRCYAFELSRKPIEPEKPKTKYVGYKLKRTVLRNF